MASIEALPAELLLAILHDPSISMFDCISLSGTTSTWRKLIQESSLAQERMWLQPDRGFLHLRTSRIKTARFGLIVTVRQLPATIWNDYQDDLWEMEWRHNHECATICWPRNPIFDHLEEFLHIVNPHFIRQPPYAGCEARMPSTMRKSLVFRGLGDLKKKLKMPRIGTEALWENMLTSQHVIARIRMHLELTIRWRGRRPASGEVRWQSCKKEDMPREELQMKDLIRGLRKCMVDTLEVLRISSLVNGGDRSPTRIVLGSSEGPR